MAAVATSPGAPASSYDDPEAVMRRFGPAGERLLRVLAPAGRLLAPLGILLGLPLVVLLLALPFLVPGVAAAFLAHALGLKPVLLTGVAIFMASMLIGLGVPYTRDRVLRYFQRLQDLSNTVPFVVRVKAGEVAYLRRRMTPVPPDPLPTWRHAAIEGPGTFIVRGGREVVWNGTREGYDKWLGETDVMSL